MRFQALDGWRGVCAVCVALFHLNVYSHIYNWPFLRNAYLLVDFFFVLSGFVIAAAYASRIESSDGLKLFIVRRIGRLYPLHIAVFLAFVVLELAKLGAVSLGVSAQCLPFSETTSLQSAITNIFLLQSFGFHDHLTWNFPSWSISSELYVNFVFGIVLFATALHMRAYRPLVYGVLLIFGVVILLSAARNGIDATYDFGFFRCLYGFFCGVFVWILYQRKREKELRWASACEVFAVSASIAFVSYTGRGAVSFLGPILFSCVVYIFALQGGFISSILLLRPFQTLGRLSYSIYLVHAFIVINFVDRPVSLIEKGFGIELSGIIPGLNVHDMLEGGNMILLGGPLQADLLGMYYIAVVIIVSHFTYKYIEVPWQTKIANAFTFMTGATRSTSRSVISKASHT